MKHIGKVMRMIVATTLAIAICLAGTPQTAKAAEIIGWTEWYPEAQSRYEGPSSPSGYREEKIETKYQYSRFLWYGPSSTNSTVTYRAASFRLVPSGWTLNKEVTTDSYSGANNGKYNVRRSALLDAPVPMSSSGGWTINGVTYWQEDKVQTTYYRYLLPYEEYIKNTGRNPHFDHVSISNPDVDVCGQCGTSYKNRDYCVSCGSYRLHDIYGNYYFLPISNSKTTVYLHPSGDTFLGFETDLSYFSANVKTRKEAGELMLGLSTGQDHYFIKADELTLDFTRLANEARSLAQADTLPSLIASFISCFKTNSRYDVKSPYNLGNKDLFNVSFDGGQTIEKMYGEAIGNILYGYVSAKCGLTLENAIYFGGLERSGLINDLKSFVYTITFQKNLELIDDKNDIISEALGFQYAETGIWSNTLSESFLSFHPSLRSIY